MRGLVVKLVSRMYYVKTERGIFKCKTKGKLRLESAEPLVGDRVIISDLDESEMEAMIEEIVDRKNSLVRPRIANVDKVFIVIAALNPEPDLDLIDKLLIQTEMNGVQPAICLNKTDLPKAELSIKELESRYRSTGYEIVFLNDKDGSHKNLISRLVKGINLFMGQSGVGKSSIINALSPDTEMEVGEVSEKLGRGRHTTRHSELSDLGSGIYICDSPGFSSFEKKQLRRVGNNRLHARFQEVQGSVQIFKLQAHEGTRLRDKRGA